MPFGIFGPRSLAMGGAGVASAATNNAVFYNPALLAQFTYDEDKGRHSQFVWPSLSVRYANVIEEISKFKGQDYDSKLSTAIADFNANNGTSSNAQAVLNASLNLQDGLSRIASGSLFADANMAFALSIPSFKGGGAFFYDRRAVGDGRIVKTTADTALLNAYIQTMEYLLSGQGAPSAEVYNNGQLNDLSGNLTSEVSATGIVMNEFGLAMAGEFTFYGQNIALGIVPKFVKTQTYTTLVNATSNSYGENRDLRKSWNLTADLGVAKKLNKQWNLGLTIKNAIPLRYNTTLNTRVKINPQLRGGVAYKTSWGMVSFDLDMLKNNSVGSGDKTQFSSLGVEWDLMWVKLRGGYNYDFGATYGGNKGLFSIGFQLKLFGMPLDAAYADNGVERAAGLQTGFAF